MIRRPLRLIFDTVAGQIILLLVLTLLSMHVSFLALFFWGDDLRPPPPGEKFGRLTAFTDLYAGSDAGARPRLLELILASDPDIARVDGLPDVARPLPPRGQRPSGSKPGPGPSADAVPQPLEELDMPDGGGKVYTPPRNVNFYLGPQAQEGPFDHSVNDLYVAFDDGVVLHVSQPSGLLANLIGPGLLNVIFLFFGSTFLVGWALMVITRPLRRFIAAVESFSETRGGVDIKEDGPSEIRAAIAAFNRMRCRIIKLLAEKTNMLAAVSHDLRTPITRLRLRAEFIEDESIRNPMLLDLDHMAALTQSALLHLSSGESREPFEPTDLPSLLQTVADQFSDLGHTVAYTGPARLTASLRMRDIQRAVTNLVENAVRYGSRVEIGLRQMGPDSLTISVADDGPGIPPEDRQRLLSPFERGDAARTSAPNTGFGLGLTIARDVAEAHGGELLLGDCVPHGLMVLLQLRLPAT